MYKFVGAWRSLVAHLVWDQGAAGSNPVAPTTSKQSSLCFGFFYAKKVIRPLPYFSSFAKSHARLVCSVVNALATTCSRYQLFASFILTRYEHPHQKHFRVFFYFYIYFLMSDHYYTYLKRFPVRDILLTYLAVCYIKRKNDNFLNRKLSFFGAGGVT